jgi:2-keto-3-deoxy-6-phosphogluconate aldolase
MQAFDKNDPQTSFGAFKPVGNVVVVFDDTISAVNAQTDLLAGGHDSMEITYMDANAFVKILDEMHENQGVLAVLGSELKKSDQFRKYAEQGACFLIAYAPSEDETKNVMNVVERYNYLFALKYGHLIIERFDPSHPA